MEELTDEDLLELWHERVGVRQFDGEHDEKRAKLLAGKDVKRITGMQGLPKWLVDLCLDKTANSCNNSNS
jgi:hypothetical protein